MRRGIQLEESEILTTITRLHLPLAIQHQYVVWHSAHINHLRHHGLTMGLGTTHVNFDEAQCSSLDQSGLHELKRDRNEEGNM